jgi:hypothetical protein
VRKWGGFWHYGLWRWQYCTGLSGIGLGSQKSSPYTVGNKTFILLERTLYINSNKFCKIIEIFINVD